VSILCHSAKLSLFMTTLAKIWATGTVNGTVIWFEMSTNKYHVKFADNDVLAFAETELQVGMDRYEEFIRRSAVPSPHEG
jgi:hypothetical protein